MWPSLAVAVGLFVGAPGDDAPGWALSWTAPAGCPTEAEVRAQVQEKRIGPVSASEATLSMQAVVRPAGRKYATSLRLTTASGERVQQLVTDDCATAAEAAVLMLVVATAAAQDATEVPPTPTPEPANIEPVREPEPIPPPPPAPAVAKQPPPVRKHSRPALPFLVAARGGGGVEVGANPAVAGAGRFGVALVWPRARLELDGQVWVPPPLRARGVQTRLITGLAAVRGCYTPRYGSVEFPICGGVEVGAMVGRATGVDAAKTVRLPWTAAAAGLGLVWFPRQRATPRVGLWLDATAAAALTRPRFTVRDVGTVHRAGPASGRVTAGIEIRFRATKTTASWH